MPRRPVPARLRRAAGPSAVLLATAGLLALGAGPAAAGTVTTDGARVRFTDPAGAKDDLTVPFTRTRNFADDEKVPADWRVGFVQTPATVVGAGCAADETAGVFCGTGLAEPDLVIDLGGGADRLLVEGDLYSKRPVAIAGGAGDDLISTFQVIASVDGGAGADVIRPDLEIPDSFPPLESPGSVIRGGPGTDTVSYDALEFPAIDVSLDGKANDGRRGEKDDVRADVENLVASQAGGRLIGSDGSNVLTGGKGEDQLAGGAGKDRLTGAGDKDLLDALDGSPGDRVSCGAGKDTAYVDAGDAVVSRSACETLSYAPALTSASLRWSARRIPVTLRCPTASAKACTGNLRFRTTAGAKVASRFYRVARGKTATIAVPAGKKPPRKAELVIAPPDSTPVAGRAVRIR